MRFVMDTHLNVLVFIWRAVIATFKNFGVGQRILPPLFHNFFAFLLVNVRAVEVVGFLRVRKIILNKVNACKLFILKSIPHGYEQLRREWFRNCRYPSGYAVLLGSRLKPERLGVCFFQSTNLPRYSGAM